jgi:AcrR family transcriptional regulator
MRSKSEQRRAHILQVAAATFTELGVENTTMSEIVNRIGGSKSTIYSYYPSKAELVQAVVNHAAEIKLREAFMLLDPASPLVDTLRRFGRIYLAQLLTPEMLSAMRIAQQDGARSATGQHFYANGPRVGWNMMQTWLEQQAAAGTLVDCDGRVAAMHLKGLLQSELLDQAMYGLPPPPAPAIQQAAERAVATFLLAYAPR